MTFGERRGKSFGVFGYPLVVLPASERPAYYFTQVEVAAGALLGLRLGVNPGELVDFLLGFARIDIFGDDRGQRRYQDELVDAIDRGDVPTIRRLIAAGVDVNAKNAQGYVPLYFTLSSVSSLKQNVEIARLLIAAGADVNATTQFGDSMLHHLNRRYHYDERQAVELADVLIDAGAQVSPHNDHGRTPLDEARRHGWKDLEALLLKHGAVAGE